MSDPDAIEVPSPAAPCARRNTLANVAPHARPGPSLTLGVTDRARFIAVAGMVLSIGFAVFIVALMVPDLFLRPCQ